MLRSVALVIAMLAVAMLPRAIGQSLIPVYETGPRSERINFVVLSEGYTSPELTTKFPADATEAIDAFLRKEPFATYREFFNAYLISVASVESGADDPSEGIVRNTYFNASFDTAGIDRLLSIGSTGRSRANSLLGSLIPEFDIALVLVNDSQYGGSGGSIPVASTNGASAEIAIHEIGHSFGGLADEYTYNATEFTPSESVNATARTDRELIRWRHWIDPGTPVPTPDTNEWSGVVGLFEGAMYRSSGWYRPTRNSLMRSLNRAFEPVNEEQLVLRLYNRLPLVLDTSPPLGPVQIDTPGELNFNVRTLARGGEHGAGLSWYLNGTPIAGLRLEIDLIERGAEWRYRDSGVAPAADWNMPGFDDSLWDEGPAKLGYGEGDEATLLSYGGDSDNKHITTWFRREFQVDDPAVFDSLELELLRDDGAIVYLNGVEVYRANIASGAVSPDDLAAITVSGSNEDGYFDALLDASDLVAGTNLIAVELHQGAADSSDLGFDLALRGSDRRQTALELIEVGAAWRYDDSNQPPPPGWRSLAFDDAPWAMGSAEFGFGEGDESTTIASGNLTYRFRHAFTVGSPQDLAGLEGQLKRDDGAVVYLNGVEIFRSNMPDGPIGPSTRASSTASDDGNRFHEFVARSQLLSPGENVLAVQVHQRSASSTDVSFDLSLAGLWRDREPPPLRRGSDWRYYDSATPPPADWKSPDFPDGAWPGGPAPLGYNASEFTRISFGGDPSNKPPTAYFRRGFELEEPAEIESFRLGARFDDGIVVYLNGTEIWRSNMPSGAVAHETLASAAALGDGGRFRWVQVPATGAVVGSNVIAVEVHQSATDSSDLVFDLELSDRAVGGFRLDPGTLANGEHVLEARLTDASGKVRQDPDDLTRETLRWEISNLVGADDSDQDGLPDNWEMLHFGDLAEGAEGDFDGDGNSNLNENLAGTDPADARSRFLIASARSAETPGSVTLTWSSVPGKNYRIMRSYDLGAGSWQQVQTASAEPGPSQTTSASVALEAGRGEVFFRIEVGVH